MFSGARAREAELEIDDEPLCGLLCPHSSIADLSFTLACIRCTEYWQPNCGVITSVLLTKRKPDEILESGCDMPVVMARQSQDSDA